MQIVYVETCPECGCAVVLSASGERRVSDRVPAGCAGCACHADVPLAAGH